MITINLSHFLIPSFYLSLHYNFRLLQIIVTNYNLLTVIIMVFNNMKSLEIKFFLIEIKNH